MIYVKFCLLLAMFRVRKVPIKKISVTQMKRIYMIILMIKEIIIFEGPLEPMLTTYHYYVGCTNDLVNKDDKLTECAALQLGVEVPKYRQDPEYDKKMSRIKSNNKRVSICFYLPLEYRINLYETPDSFHPFHSELALNCLLFSFQNPFSKYQSEIEQLDDAAFLKRHEKPEQLEKRTKK